MSATTTVVPGLSAAVIAATTPPPLARIARIKIEDYRAFPPNDPLTIELGPEGKNLLLYGENGSGKTSLARGLRDLTAYRNPPEKLESQRHLFGAPIGTPQSIIAVEFTGGTVNEFRWGAGDPHPHAVGRQTFQAFARGCLSLDYRDLLETNYRHNGTPNLFECLLSSVLDGLRVLDGGKRKRLGDLLTSTLAARPTDESELALEGVATACAAFSDALQNHLPEVVKGARDIFAKLGHPGTDFTLTPRAFAYDKIKKKFTLGQIDFEVTHHGERLAAPQHFLNEARLTALALALYLGAAQVAVSAPTPSTTAPAFSRVLIMDDVLIGLDLTNRLPLLKVLAEDFSDWQVILLTHDVTWFNMAREKLSEEHWSYQRLHLVHDIATGRERPLHVLETTYLESATRLLAAADFPAAGVYLRATFEALLRDFCETKRLLVPFKRELRELTSEDLWPRVKDWKFPNGDFLIPASLAEEIEFCRRFILNPLCHDAQGRPLRAEVELASFALRQLESLVKSLTSWRQAWELKNPKGSALPKDVYFGLAEWMLAQTPALAAEDVAVALRATFAQSLHGYARKHKVPLSYTADAYLSLKLLWESAKTAGLAFSQPAFVAACDANTTWLIDESPSRLTLSAVTSAQLVAVFDTLRDGTSAATLRNVLRTW